MNKYNGKIVRVIKTILFNIIAFAMSFFPPFLIIYNLCDIDLSGAITFSGIISIFGIVIFNLFRCIFDLED